MVDKKTRNQRPTGDARKHIPAYEIDPLPSQRPTGDAHRRLAAYDVDSVPGDILEEGETYTPARNRLTKNDPQVGTEYDLTSLGGVEDEEDGEIRAIRKRVFLTKAQIQLIEAKATLANYLKGSTEAVELVGLDAVAGLVESEVVKARGTDPALRLEVGKLAPSAARTILEPMLKKGRRFRVTLKPGYEEIAQKELASFQPSNPFLETMIIFLKLNTIGYVLVNEI